MAYLGPPQDPHPRRRLFL